MRIIYLIIVSLLLNAELFAQKEEIVDLSGGTADTLVAKKVKCNCEIQGFKIKILEHKDDQKYVKYGYNKYQLCNYSYLDLYTAKQDSKIGLLEQLLLFENDTSRVCMKVHAYSMRYVDSIDRIGQPTYSINIDALYHINFIFFEGLAPYYAPVPVLYDTATNQVINNDANKVREVFGYYRKWYEQCKLNNFKNYSFPLLNTRYRWKLGHTDDRKMEKISTAGGEVMWRMGQPKRKIGNIKKGNRIIE